MIWVATADTNTCRIYNYDKSHSQLSFQKDLQHLTERELLDFLKTHAQYPDKY